MQGFFWILSILTKADFEVDGLTFRVTNNKAIVVGCNISDSKIQIPSSVTYESTSYPVDSIDSQAFSMTTKEYTEIYFPHTLTDFGDYTFQQFKNLEKVGYVNENNEIIENTIPPLVKRLGSFLFSNCLSLKKVDANNVQTIDMSCFKQCYALESFECGTFLRGINAEAFESCYNLKSFSAKSNSINVIQYAFCYCQSLKEFDFSKCKLVSSNAFEGTGLVEVDLSMCKYTTVETELFMDCVSLSSVKFPKGLLEIRSQSFYGCISLTQLDLYDVGNHLTITQQAFQGCTSLKSVVFESQPAMLYENCFFGCSALESVKLLNVTYPDSGSIIDNYAFYNCTSLRYFEFDKWTFLKIGESTFYNCPLTESISFIGTVSPINFTISLNAFTSAIIKSVDFRNCSRLQLVPNSFACPNLNCVMIDENRRNIAEIAFKSDIINGVNCPNYPTASPLPSPLPTQTPAPTETPAPTDNSKISKKTFIIIIASSAGALGLIIIIVISVVVVRKKKAGINDVNSKPLITTEDAPRYQ